MTGTHCMHVCVCVYAVLKVLKLIVHAALSVCGLKLLKLLVYAA